MSGVRDIRNQLKPFVALLPQTIATDTTTVGPIIYTADYGRYTCSLHYKEYST